VSENLVQHLVVKERKNRRGSLGRIIGAGSENGGEEKGKGRSNQSAHLRRDEVFIKHHDCTAFCENSSNKIKTALPLQTK